MSKRAVRSKKLRRLARRIERTARCQCGFCRLVRRKAGVNGTVCGSERPDGGPVRAQKG